MIIVVTKIKPKGHATKKLDLVTDEIEPNRPQINKELPNNKDRD